MNKFTKSFIAAVLFLGAGSVSAEIQTVIKEGNDGIRSFKDFSTKETPCFVEPQYAFLFAEAGMNIVNDDNADCRISFNGYVVFAKKETWPVTRISAEYIVENRDKLPEVGPALASQPTAPNADQVADNASGMGGKLSATRIDNLTQAGGALNGMDGSITGFVIGTLINTATAANAAKNTPAGVGNAWAAITFGTGWLKPAILGVNAYSASTTKENPVDLLRAAVKRLVLEVQAKEDEFKRKEEAKSSVAGISVQTVGQTGENYNNSGKQ